ncbi:WXG100-like domain-containing protein [Nocardia transvalensis]|uniref:WXG100-like domain-containing protein n=1 Tax=Nocardia transvalensis TaxID=37333 RepID=UPI0002F60360
MAPPTFPIIVCRPTDYHSAGESFGGVRDGADEVHGALVRTLQGYSGMAGSDSAGTSWAATYDDSVDAALQASSKLITQSARIRDLLAAGAYNHVSGDAAANPSGTTPPDPPILGVEPCPALSVPSASGAGTAEPFGWSLINAVAGLAWPNGHQDQLRAARDVWYAAADALGTATTPITTAVSLLENQQSPEIPTAIATCSQSTADYMDLQAGFRELGDACGDYAQQLDDAHSEILDELGKMLAETAAWEVGMAVLIPFTGALSELLGNGAAVARIAVYAARIGRVIERLAGAAATIAARVAASVPVRLRAMASKIGQWLEKAKTKLWKSGDGSPPPVPTPKPPATKPTVNDSKLQNILNDLYKGAGNPDRVGDGTTADAIRNEYANLVPTEGKWHLTKGVESQRALANWLMNRANNDPADRAVAIKELQNLMDALAGK